MVKFVPTREEIEAVPVGLMPEADVTASPNRLVMPQGGSEKHLSRTVTVMVGNEKGGVGKTTVAVHLAMGMAALGYRVVLVDGDPQGHATTRSGIRKQAGLYDLLVRDAEWHDKLVRVEPERYGIVGDALPVGKLWVLPSNVETRNIANSISEVEVLTQRIEDLAGLVDIVMIDTSPTPSLLHGAFYAAADGIIYPTKLTYTAFDGLVESWKRREASNMVRQNRGLPPIDMWGVVPLDYRRNTLEQQENLDELVKLLGRDMVWKAIPQATLWTETEGRAQPVWQLEPAGGAAKEAWALISQFEQEVLKRVSA